MYEVEEAAMEDFLVRLAAGFKDECEGATDEEIQRIEEVAGQPLPRFYKWLLSRAGRDGGPLAGVLHGFSVSDVSAAYDDVLAAYEEDEVDPAPGLLLIGVRNDEVMPVAYQYDLGVPLRDDALVLFGPLYDSQPGRKFETLRERVAWSAALSFRIAPAPQKCNGSFKDEEKDVATKLDQVLTDLGFTCPIPTGPFCKIYEGKHSTLICTVTPKDRNRGLLFFDFAGEDVGELRRTLGEIAARTSVEVTVERWESAE